MANIAEGFARIGTGEWGHSLSLALGSCAETKSHLYVSLDCGYITDEEMKSLYEDLDDIGRMLHKLRVKAKQA